MNNRFRRALSFITAAVLLLSTCCFSASANANGVTVEVDQKMLTLEELQTAGYQVPVYVRLTENAGINAFEFGVDVDERCSYEIVTISRKALELGGEALDYVPAGNKAEIAWFAWANGEVETYTGTLALIMVTVPEDAQPGDWFSVDYVAEYSQPHVWHNGIDQIDYIEAGNVDFYSGGIQIAVESCEVTFDANGGTCATASLSCKPDEAFGTLPVPEKDGASFLGWFDEDGTKVTEDTLVPQQAALTLTAKWQSDSIAAGDVDLDGKVSILDAITLSKSLMGVGSLTIEQAVQADCNGDSTISSTDALCLLKYLVGLVPTLPAV